MNVDAKYPDVSVQLTGGDGNIFAIIGAVAKALRRAGCEKDEIDDCVSEVMDSVSYDQALQTIMKWVDVK